MKVVTNEHLTFMLLCNLKKRKRKKRKEREELCSNVFLKTGSCDGLKLAEEKGGMEVRNIPEIEPTGICYDLTWDA